MSYPTVPWLADEVTIIRRLRVMSGLTQVEAATRLGFGRRTMFDLEAGTRVANHAQVRALAVLFDVPIARLLTAMFDPEVALVPPLTRRALSAAGVARHAEDEQTADDLARDDADALAS